MPFCLFSYYQVFDREKRSEKKSNRPHTYIYLRNGKLYCRQRFSMQRLAKVQTQKTVYLVLNWFLRVVCVHVIDWCSIFLRLIHKKKCTAYKILRWGHGKYIHFGSFLFCRLPKIACQHSYWMLLIKEHFANTSKMQPKCQNWVWWDVFIVESTQIELYNHRSYYEIEMHGIKIEFKSSSGQPTSVQLHMYKDGRLKNRRRKK